MYREAVGLPHTMQGLFLSFMSLFILPQLLHRFAIVLHVSIIEVRRNWFAAEAGSGSADAAHVSLHGCLYEPHGRRFNFYKKDCSNPYAKRFR